MSLALRLWTSFASFCVILSTNLFALAQASTLPTDTSLPKARYAFRSYGVEQGLTNLVPLVISQDSLGFLWVGTEDGLFRYNGRRFTRFDQHDGLPSIIIDHIVDDGKGTLWIGSPRGLVRYKDQGFTVLGGESGLPTTTIEALRADPEGCVWVGLSSGLYKSCDGAHFQALDSWPGGPCTALLHVGQDQWYAAAENELRFLNTQGIWTKWGQESGLGEERIDDVLLDASGQLWARSVNYLWLRPTRQDHFQRMDRGLSKTYWRGRLLLGPNGQPWVPTTAGLARWDPENRIWDLLDSSRGFPASAFALSAFIDKENSVWIGGAGLHRWLGNGRISIFTQHQGLAGDNVLSIYRDQEKRLWVGTEQGLAFATSAGFQTLPQTRGYAIVSVMQDLEGNYWMGGGPVEVLKWNPRSDQTEHFGKGSGLRGKRITHIQMDGQNRIWVATDGGGLLFSVRDPLAPGGIRFKPAEIPGGTPTETFRSLLVDKEGRLWAAGGQGLALHEQATWQRFTTHDGLRHNDVAYLSPSFDGSMRVAYWEPFGISRFDFKNGRFGVLDSMDSAKVYLMGEDPLKHWLWLGTGQGLDIVTDSGIRHLSQTDGLPGDDFDALAFLADPNGDLWMGTSTGLLLYHSVQDSGWPNPPKTAILNAQMDNIQLPVQNSTSEKYPHGSTFSAQYAGLSFLNESQVNYHVKLEGFDKEFRATDLPEARFTNLGAGNYSFQVRSRIGKGPWGPLQNLAFTIRPAWWQTPWFILGSLTLLLTLSYQIVRFRVAMLRRRNEELSALVQARTQELYTRNTELAESLQTITETQARLRDELGEAAAYIRSNLPQPLQKPVLADYRFLPSAELGGDGLGYFLLDDHHLVIYLLDACGHGMPAALLSISVLHALKSRTLPNADFSNPSEVLRALNNSFPSANHNGLYFTIWYGVLNTQTRELKYANGGHPPALMISRESEESPVELGITGPMIGLLPDMEFDTERIVLKPDARLYVFSDGAFEILKPNRELIAYDAFIEELLKDRHGPPALDHVLEFARTQHGNDALDDDISLVVVDMLD